MTALAAAAASFPVFKFFSLEPSRCTVVKISPLDSYSYPESFLKFCRKSSFKTPRDAIMSVRDQSYPFDLVVEYT